MIADFDELALFIGKELARLPRSPNTFEVGIKHGLNKMRGAAGRFHNLTEFATAARAEIKRMPDVPDDRERGIIHGLRLVLRNLPEET